MPGSVREREDRRRGEAVQRGGEAADADRAAAMLLEAVELPLGAGHRCGQVLGLVGERPAGRRQGQGPATAPAGPVNQRHPGLGLELAEVLGDPGRRQVERPGRRQDAAGPADRAQYEEPVRVQGHSARLNHRITRIRFRLGRRRGTLDP